MTSLPGRRLLPLMLVMFLIGGAEVVAGPMMAPMGDSFGVPAARIAWLPASYALVYAVLAPLLGPLSDRLGRKALLLPALVGFGVANAGIALAPVFAVALPCAALAGLSAAAMAPNAVAIVADTVDAPRQPAAMGRILAGLTVSFVLTPAGAALVAARLDWRVAYVAMAVGALLAAVATMPLQRPEARPRAGVAVSIGAAFRQAGATPRLAATFLWLGVSIGVITVMAEILRRRYGLSTEALGLALGLFGLVTIAGNLLIPAAVRRLGSPSRAVLAGIAGTLAGILVLGVLPTLPAPLAVAAGALWALGYGVAGPTHQAVLAGMAASLRGTTVALTASLVNLGIVVVAFGAGRFFDTLGIEATIGVAAAGVAAGFAVLLATERRQAAI
ncbi:putative MFS family arabinose efflux permease [Inquilinus ginsengisoli]|uniref:MFS family arabinose efflux permease n=1 Tax=Inquilinus ginsengisoli TaxID=363840 RepID=A0ABU1JVY4_9PROT|nr:MFS transporter [Inquilinus ginsengisoli]MDR6291720.1 putative MFS family arabinose efflux permease [Inquilinus ginsengisoli]